MSKLLAVLGFYLRFLPSFTRIGYLVRRITWSNDEYDLTGQVWLVTGATGGIGSATVLKALEHGATVIVAARDTNKMSALKEKAGAHADRLIGEIVDLSLQSEVRRFVTQLSKRLATQSEKIDVLSNNVGVINDEHKLTAEGFETTYALNLLNHHLLTTSLIDQDLLSESAGVINVTSGGMYNAPLNTVMINQTAERFNGIAAYTSHKRAQMTLTDYYRATYRETHQDKDLHFYCVHPGWVDTDGVKTALPNFRAMLWPILRNNAQGADTIVWIGATTPSEVENSVWFDRKPRPAHVMEASRTPLATAEQLVTYLNKDLET